MGSPKKPKSKPKYSLSEKTKMIGEALYDIHGHRLENLDINTEDHYIEFGDLSGEEDYNIDQYMSVNDDSIEVSTVHRFVVIDSERNRKDLDDLGCNYESGNLEDALEVTCEKEVSDIIPIPKTMTKEDVRKLDHDLLEISNKLYRAKTGHFIK